MKEITYEIIEHIADLSTDRKGWIKELNLIKWNNAEPKYDLRSWSPDKSKMGKGITLTEEEVQILKEVLDDLAI